MPFDYDSTGLPPFDDLRRKTDMLIFYKSRQMQVEIVQLEPPRELRLA